VAGNQFLLQFIGGTDLPAGGDRETYLKELERAANVMDWGKLDPEFAKADDAGELRLIDVYISLDTTTPRRMDTEADIRSHEDRLRSRGEDTPRRTSANNNLCGFCAAAPSPSATTACAAPAATGTTPTTATTTSGFGLFSLPISLIFEPSGLWPSERRAVARR
jgi:hypothetical protein